MAQLVKILSPLSFLIVTITSIPLLITYLKGVSPEYSFIVDLHVWSGVIFIFFAILRMTKSKSLDIK